MYFTISELRLLVLRRQLQVARQQYRYAKDRHWDKAIKRWQGETARLSRHVENQERVVAQDLTKRSMAKAQWMEKLA